MVKIKVVYGAPCSGKTTYVNNRLGLNDLIYDFDDIMLCISKLPYQEKNPYLISYVIDIRDTIINKLKNERNIDTAFIITTFIRDDLKEKLNGIEVDYIHMDTDIYTCMSRANDSEREDKDKIINVIKKWFAEYSWRDEQW